MGSRTKASASLPEVVHQVPPKCRGQHCHAPRRRRTTCGSCSRPSELPSPGIHGRSAGEARSFHPLGNRYMAPLRRAVPDRLLERRHVSAAQSRTGSVRYLGEPPFRRRLRRPTVGPRQPLSSGPGSCPSQIPFAVVRQIFNSKSFRDFCGCARLPIPNSDLARDRTTASAAARTVLIDAARGKDCRLGQRRGQGAWHGAAFARGAATVPPRP